MTESKKVYKKLDEEEKEWNSFIDFIDSLKAEGDIDKLLQEYELLARSRDQYGLEDSKSEYSIDEEEKRKFDYALRVLENLDIKGYIKEEKKDPCKRYLGYQCLFDIGTLNNIFFSSWVHKNWYKPRE